MSTLELFEGELWSPAGHRLAQNLEFRMGLGEVKLVCGRNGAGKSTFLNGLATADNGDLTASVNALGHHWDLPLEKEKKRDFPPVAYLPQHMNRPRLRVCEVLGAIARWCKMSPASTRVRTVLKRYAIDELEEKQCFYLSGGEFQRVSLALIFIQLAASKDPHLVLLDEPLSGLDDHFTSVFADDIKSQNQHWTLIATHAPDSFALKSDERIRIGTNV